ncbi:hypothetical protein Golax_022528, partial [Gossypium laxum]|nr:hypothetical protein [Gossypium laxum]
MRRDSWKASFLVDLRSSPEMVTKHAMASKGML